MERSFTGFRVLIVFGVSGSGKTTVGRLVAGELGWDFLDADDFHSVENIAKMRAGLPLNDADRQPWLAAMRAVLEEFSISGTGAVLACSALKAGYRQILAVPGARFVYLKGSFEQILARLQSRSDHFMPSDLLRSQFDALEPPGPNEAWTVEIVREPAVIAAEIVRMLYGLSS